MTNLIDSIHCELKEGAKRKKAVYYFRYYFLGLVFLLTFIILKKYIKLLQF